MPTPAEMLKDVTEKWAEAARAKSVLTEEQQQYASEAKDLIEQYPELIPEGLNTVNVDGVKVGYANKKVLEKDKVKWNDAAFYARFPKLCKLEPNASKISDYMEADPAALDAMESFGVSIKIERVFEVTKPKS
jgi:predicted S18 family serine protease